jgi:hypothetical protein
MFEKIGVFNLTQTLHNVYMYQNIPLIYIIFCFYVSAEKIN